MRKYMLALAAFLIPVFLSIPAYASGFSDDRGDSIGGGRDTVTALTKAMSDLVGVMEQVYHIMVSNPLLVVLVASSLFAVGVRIFRKVKNSAKR